MWWLGTWFESCAYPYSYVCFILAMSTPCCLGHGTSCCISSLLRFKASTVSQLCFSHNSASSQSTVSHMHWFLEDLSPFWPNILASVQSVQTSVIKIFPFSHPLDHVPLLLKSQHWLLFPIKFQPASSSVLLNSVTAPSSWKAFSSAGNACGWGSRGYIY